MIIAEYVGERKDSNTKIIDSSYVYLPYDGTKIDAKDYGNMARFFHHCPSDHTDKQVMTANLATIGWDVSETLKKVFFITFMFKRWRSFSNSTIPVLYMSTVLHRKQKNYVCGPNLPTTVSIRLCHM